MTDYRSAGVDLAGADRHVEAIRSLVTATWGPNIVGGFGGFAAGIELPEGMTRPVLMMSTDGVGTKLDVARQLGMWDGVGFDLVAMCVDDLTAVGAQPLGFVDYMAVGSLDPDRDTRVVASIAAACTQVGAALVGGETAEHPGVMDPDAIDLAGAALGVVEAGHEITGDRVETGDLIVGLASRNLRSNGFSLVRRVLEGVGEEGGGGGGEAGRWATVHLRSHRVEIDEPTLEDRPRKRLQRRIHPTVQLDLAVQRTKDRRDRSLIFDWWPLDLDWMHMITI